MSSGNHDGTVTVSRSTQTATATIVGLGQPAPASREVSFSIDMTSDLGPNGSLTLEATAKNYPGSLYGSAYPVLVYLSDGTNDYINLSRSGVAGDCATKGYFNCSGGSCSANSGCAVSWPSAYNDRSHWEQHQITLPHSNSDPYQAFPSVNTFPSCNWTGGSAPPNVSQPACSFNSTFFPTGGGYPTPRLRYGVTYTAKYVLLANSYSSLTGYTADIELTVVKKSDSNAGGAVDLNVFLVGTKNVSDSRTTAGQRNLDTLFTAVYTTFNQANTGVKLGAINAIEWPCSQCGDYYANIELADINFMYSKSAPLHPSGTQGRALNLYMVSTIPDSSSGSGFTILGVSGGIGGSVSHGGATSGVSFSSFNKLKTYNSSCSTNPCPETSQDADFWDFGQTIAHEMGHYLGLNHPTERAATWHDIVDDTPICTAKSASNTITITTCKSTDTNTYMATGNKCSDVCTTTYCPTQIACQFNHVMWWTSKRFSPIGPSKDGDLFSPSSSQIINYNSLIQ